MSLFGDLDVESIPDNPWAIPDNTYRCTVTGSERTVTNNTKDKPDDEKKWIWLITYTIQDGECVGQEIQERKSIPDIPPGTKYADLTSDQQRALKFIRQRMTSLGVPASRQNDEDIHEQVIGIDCAVTVKTRDPQYPPNVQKVELLNEAPVVAGSSDGLNVFRGM